MQAQGAAEDLGMCQEPSPAVQNWEDMLNDENDLKWIVKIMLRLPREKNVKLSKLWFIMWTEINIIIIIIIIKSYLSRDTYFIQDVTICLLHKNSLKRLQLRNVNSKVPTLNLAPK